MSVLVVGLDPSFTSFGVSDGDRHVRITTSPDDGAFVRARSIVSGLFSFLGVRHADTGLVFVVEGPAYGQAMHGALWDAGYLASSIDQLAQHAGAVVYTVQPTALKKFVTGKGNTPKGDMALRVYKKWGIEFDDDRGLDKLHAYCLHRYGLAILAGEIDHETKRRGKGKRAEAAQRKTARTKAGVS